MEIAVAFWIACGVFAGIVANSKRRSGCLWGVLGVLFGPIALLAVGFMPVGEVTQKPPAAQPVNPVLDVMAASIKRCPKCSRGNPPYALHCEFCGSNLEDSSGPKVVAE